MLELAQGFTTQLPGPVLQADGPQLTESDVNQIMAGQAGPWLLSMMATQPLLEETPLDSQVVSPLLLEFFAAQAIIAFQVKADSVMPRAALGRLILMDYAPWKRRDPPVMLLSLLPLDPEAIQAHNRAIHDLLANQGARRMHLAIRSVLWAGVGILTQAEAFYYYAKTISLATGAFHQRYDTINVIQ